MAAVVGCRGLTCTQGRSRSFQCGPQRLQHRPFSRPLTLLAQQQRSFSDLKEPEPTQPASSPSEGGDAPKKSRSVSQIFSNFLRKKEEKALEDKKRENQRWNNAMASTESTTDSTPSEKEVKDERVQEDAALSRVFAERSKDMQSPKANKGTTSFLRDFFKDSGEPGIPSMSVTKKSKTGSAAQMDNSSSGREDRPSLMEILFPKRVQTRVSLESLKYLPIYPAPVKRWVKDAKTERGVYNPEGQWTTVPIREGEQYAGDEEDRLAISKVPMHFRDDNELPPDLRGAYRFDIRPDEVENVSAKLREVMTLKYANKAEILRYRTRMLSKNWGKFEGDTGHSAVQVCVLTEKIRSMRLHLKKNVKDYHMQYAMNRYINRRHTLLKYLRRKDGAAYWKVLKAYNLKETT